MTEQPFFDMASAISMIEDLYELEKEDLEGEYCTAEMMIRQGKKLLGGLDEIKTALLSRSNSEADIDKTMVENKVFDLNRVMEMFIDLAKVDESDIRGHELEMFAAAKRETKIVLDSLKELNENGWFNLTKTKKQQRGSTFNIGCNLEDVVSMLEALGSSNLDDMDNDTMLSAKEMKRRSALMLVRLPDVLKKLDNFLMAANNGTSNVEVIQSVEEYVVVLKRVIGVLEAVQSSHDDEVDFAVYQLYGAFQDIEREARSVLESIYTIQFGEDAPRSHQASPKSQRKEMKGSGSKDSPHGNDYDSDVDYPSAKEGGDSDAKESSRMAQNNPVVPHAPIQFGTFDLSIVMAMLIDLGEDEENSSNVVEDEVEMIVRQSTVLVRYNTFIHGLIILYNTLYTLLQHCPASYIPFCISYIILIIQSFTIESIHHTAVFNKYTVN